MTVDRALILILYIVVGIILLAMAAPMSGCASPPLDVRPPIARVL